MPKAPRDATWHALEQKRLFKDAEERFSSSLHPSDENGLVVRDVDGVAMKQHCDEAAVWRQTLAQRVFRPVCTWQQLRHSRTVEEGTLSMQEEILKRAAQIELLSAVGLALAMPDEAIASAAHFFHTFYHRVSFRDVDPEDTVCACLLLSSKLNECRLSSRNGGAKRIRELRKTMGRRGKKIGVVEEIDEKLVSHDEPDNTAKSQNVEEALQKQIERVEYSVSRQNVFDATYTPPHRWIFLAIGHLIQYICNVLPLRRQCTLTRYLSVAFSLLHQSLRAPLSLVAPPQHIALTCVELALRHEVLLRGDEEHLEAVLRPPRDWYTLLDETCNEEQVARIAKVIVSVCDFASNELLRRRHKKAQKNDAPQQKRYQVPPRDLLQPRTAEPLYSVSA
ncbi:MAG: hypothetical protein MHM6MM_003783 [Cercozoa sp. M6MM]